MPNIENLERKTETSRNNYSTAHRKDRDFLYKDDIKTAFGYAIVGIMICLGAAGIAYTVGRKLIA